MCVIFFTSRRKISVRVHPHYVHIVCLLFSSIHPTTSPPLAYNLREKLRRAFVYVNSDSERKLAEEKNVCIFNFTIEFLCHIYPRHKHETSLLKLSKFTISVMGKSKM